LGTIAQPNINRVEYFIDTDPGMGMATDATITPGTNLANQTITFDPTALAPGVHIFGIRSRNANGAWSHTNYLAFAKAFPPLTAEPAITNITRVEYFIDTDPGMGLATAVAITPGTNLANQTISFDPTALAPGVHIVGIRSRNANGAWSHTNYLAFAKAFPPLPAEPVPGNLQQIEYFIDTDPGMGSGIQVAFAPGKQVADAVAQINITGVTAGTHTLGWRSRQANGAWGHTVFLNFNVPATLAAPAIVVNSVSKTILCAGDSLEVGIHVSGNYQAGNAFQVQISDAAGSFTNPIPMGSINGSGNQLLKLKLPAHLPDGTGYKLRINSTSPAVTGTAGTITLTIRDRPYAQTITGRTQVNGGLTYPYNVSAVAGSTFKWLAEGGTQASGTNTHAITALWNTPNSDSVNRKLQAVETNQYGCVGDTGLLAPITVYRLDIGDTVSTSVCKADILVVKAGITGSFDEGNILTAQLSNASGNFNSPTATATFAYTGNGVNQLATLSLPIPANLPNGNGYRVRIRSSLPVFTGDTTGNIAIQKPNVGNDISGAYCQGLGYNLMQHYTNNAITYTYFTNGFVPVIKPDSVQAGIYLVIGKNSFGCPDTAQVTVSEHPKPNIGADTTLLHICAGEKSNLNPLYNTTGLTAIWNTGTPALVSPGHYQLIVTNSFGCKDTAMAFVVLPTATWTGAISTDWHTAGNWSTGKVPDATTHVIIATASPRACIISNSNAEAASVQVKNPGSLQQTNGRQLIILGKCAQLPTP
jgi:hypothetical protein